MRKRNVRHKHRPKATRRPLRVELDFETCQSLTGRYRERFPAMASLGRSMLGEAPRVFAIDIDWSDTEKRILSGEYAKRKIGFSPAFGLPYGGLREQPANPYPELVDQIRDIYGDFAAVMGMDLASGPDRFVVAIRGADGTLRILDEGEPDPLL